MKQLVFAKQAQTDLLEIQQYIARDKPTAAVRFVDGLEQECRLLAKFPGLGTRRDDLAEGLRLFTCRGYGIYIHRAR
jgi:plasmid stabilization system protein ParE